MTPKSLASLVILFSIFAGNLFAVPAPVGEREFTQPDGTKFTGRLIGDEWFHWYETAEGHPILQDATTRVWYYAKPQTEGIGERTTQVVGKDAAPSAAWRPKVSAEVIADHESALQHPVPVKNLNGQAQSNLLLSGGQAAIGSSLLTTRPTTDSSALLNATPPSPKLWDLSGTTPAAGSVTQGNLAIFMIKFKDQQTQTHYAPSDFENALFVNSDPNALTMKKLYEEMSYGAFTVTSGPSGIQNWYVSAQNHDYYGANVNNAKGKRVDDANAEALARETVQQAIANGFDFGPYDTDNDGYVDAVGIIYEGTGEAAGGQPSDIWPHKSLFSKGSGVIQTTSVNALGNPVKIDNYIMCPELATGATPPAGAPANALGTIGVFCHEYGHALGLPDLYDIDYTSQGVGDWSLMAYGCNAQVKLTGDAPCWFDAWCRFQMGWVTPIRLTNNLQQVRVPDAKKENTAYLLWTNGVQGNEYFLVENRQNTGRDVTLPSSGLLVYHCDDGNPNPQGLSHGGSNANEWTPTNSGKGHYHVALVQADGNYEMDQLYKVNPDKTVTGYGDAGDPYIAGRDLDDNTAPASRAYNVLPAQGYGNYTNVAIHHVSASGDVMTADMFVNVDRDFPQVTVIDPQPGTLYNAFTTFSGYASDSSGVQSVRVAVQENQPGGRWFNWTTNTFDSTTFDSTHEKIADGTNSWSVVMPSSLPDGGYIAAFKAVDTKQAESAYTYVYFNVQADTTAPTITIDSPTEGAQLNAPPNVTGTANDNVAVMEKRVALSDRATGKWFNWNTQAFDDTQFDFARHVSTIADGDTNWSKQLPSNLAQGSYQIAVQAVDTTNQGSIWVYRSFMLEFKPIITVTSVAPNALLNSFPTITGTAFDKSGTGLLNNKIGITIYRDGQYWNGTSWQNDQFVIYVDVDPSGNWSYSPISLTGSGVIAISAFAVDNSGNTSDPVNGTNPNQVIFHLDMDPPTCAIAAPVEGAVVTTESLPGDWFAGTASDGQSNPSVTVYLKRSSDNAFWNGKNWVYSADGAGMSGVFAGTDGLGSAWSTLQPVPHLGDSSYYCMPNGAYEIIAIAQDAAGNQTQVSTHVTIDYHPNFLQTVLNPSQTAPIDPDSVPSAEVARNNAHSANDTRAQSPRFARQDAAGNYYIGTSLITYSDSGGPGQSAFYAAVIQKVGAWRLERQQSTVTDNSDPNNPISHFYENWGGQQFEIPSADYGNWLGLGGMEIDGQGNTYAAFTVYTLQQTYWLDSSAQPHYYNAPGYSGRVFVMKFDTNGNVVFRQFVGSNGGLNDPYYFYPTTTLQQMRVAADGSIALLLHNYYSSSSPYGGSYYVTQTVLSRLAPDGSVAFNKFFGYGGLSQDDTYQSAPEFVAADSAGNLFFASNDSLPGASGASLQVLHKVDSTGQVLGQASFGFCTGDSSWGALEVDGAGNVYVGSTFNFTGADQRQSVLKFDNNLNQLWRALSPSNTGGSTIGLKLSTSGVTIGAQAIIQGTDYWAFTRFAPDGTMLWSRMDTIGPVSQFVLDSDENLLIWGYLPQQFGFRTAYGKIASNGDLQFAKSLDSAQNNVADLVRLNNNKAGFLYIDNSTGEGVVQQYDNPANQLIPVALEASAPLDASALIGSNITLSVVNHGSPATYQWRKQDGNGVPQNIPGATGATLVISNGQASNSGKYSVIVTNGLGPATSRTATVSFYQLIGLAQALNNSSLTWSTGGSAPWFGQTAVSSDGDGSAQSGHVSNGNESWLQTTVTGPDTLQFQWKITGDGYGDYLYAYLDPTDDSDGTMITWITPEQDWVGQSVNIPSGTHTVRFVFFSSYYGDGGTAWVDHVALQSAFVPPPQTTSPTFTNTTAGAPFSYQITASNQPTSYSATLQGGDPLPNGISIDPNTGIISGSFLTPGSYTFDVAATNVGGTTHEIVTINVQSYDSSDPNAALFINPAVVTGKLGVPFSFKVNAAHDLSSYLALPGLTVTATGLPPGITLDQGTASLTGIPTQAGSFLANLRATIGSFVVRASLEFYISDDAQFPQVVASSSAVVQPGQPFTFHIGVTGTDANDPVTYSYSGALPPELSLNPSTGIISGTVSASQSQTSAVGNATASSRYNVPLTIYAHNSHGAAAQQLKLAVVSRPLSLLRNISTRLNALTGDNVPIGGFIITGKEPKMVIIRAIGPSLTAFGIANALADPVLELHDSTGAIIATNDNWKSDQQQEIQASGFAPSNDSEAAIMRSLAPGAYTAIVTGKNSSTGAGLVEVYDLDRSVDSTPANISTRGFVDTGNNMMIGGFIVGQGIDTPRVIVRAIGPSLVPFGISNALADPVLELHDGNGNLIAMNDNWKDTQQADIQASHFAPSNDLESAIVTDLAPGAWTAIVSGKNSTTGVGLVEVYRLNK